MAQGVQTEDLRASSIWGGSGSKTKEEQKGSNELLRWLLFVPLILLLVFGCGSLALIPGVTVEPVDNLELEVLNDGVVQDEDDKTIEVGA
ncbi:MAG: hypothetical protein IH953_06390 [Chloroflexi bacterium]|nr:hypothetical protein [Chloroflexota bacterium]